MNEQKIQSLFLRYANKYFVATKKEKEEIISNIIKGLKLRTHDRKIRNKVMMFINKVEESNSSFQSEGSDPIPIPNSQISFPEICLPIEDESNDLGSLIHGKVSGKEIAIISIIEGLGIDQVRRICTKLGLRCCHPSACFCAQKQIEKVIHQHAVQSTLKNARNISNETILSFDGSWSHSRNASQCIGTFVDLSNKKIVDYHIAENDSYWNKGNYKGYPQGMETECFRNMASRWIHNDKVIGICQDNDNDHGGILKELGWNIRIYVDPNHNFKHFKNRLKKLLMKNKNLRIIENSLQMHMWRLSLNDKLTSEQKKIQWYHAANHLTGDHKECNHKLYRHSDSKDTDSFKIVWTPIEK